MIARSNIDHVKNVSSIVSKIRITVDNVIGYIYKPPWEIII